MNRTALRADLPTTLAGQIVDLIRDQNLKPGDRLPTARALATTFEVATPTVREALTRLQATGVIDIRHGSGIYVLGDTERMVLVNPVHRLERDKARIILDLLDARLLIEPTLASQAAVHATPDDIDELEGVLAEAGRLLAAAAGDDVIGPKNMTFHTTIARIANNIVLSNVMQSLVELYISEQLTIQFLFDARTRDYREHISILEAIRNHDARLAEDRMRAHIGEVRAVVARTLAEGGMR